MRGYCTVAEATAAATTADANPLVLGHLGCLAWGGVLIEHLHQQPAEYVQYSTVLFRKRTVQYNSAGLIKYCTVLYCADIMVLYRIVLYGTVQYCIMAGRCAVRCSVPRAIWKCKNARDSTEDESAAVLYCTAL